MVTTALVKTVSIVNYKKIFCLENEIFDVKKETWTGVNVGFVVERKVFVPRCPLIFWRKFLRKIFASTLQYQLALLHLTL